MASFEGITFTAFFLIDGDFFITFIFKNCGGNRSAMDEGGAYFERRPFAEHKDVMDGYAVARFSILITIYKKDIAFLNYVLITLCFNSRFH